MTTTRQPVVYRIYDADERLIYIGSTSHPEQRLTYHRTQSWWYSLCSRVSYELHDDLELARTAEWAAIAAEDPTFNIALRPGRPISRPLPLSPSDARICREWHTAKKGRGYVPMSYRWALAA